MMPLSKSIRFSKPLLGADLIKPEERDAALSNGQVSSLDDSVEIMPYILEQMRAQVYAEGVKDGMAKERERYEVELSKQIESVELIIKGLQGLKVDLVGELHDCLPELILESVGRLLAAWQPDQAAIQSIVEELLSGVDATDHTMCIRLSPQALELLTEARAESYIKQYSQLEFVGDARLALGECVLEGRFGLSDARYSAKLKNLRGVLHHE